MAGDRFEVLLSAGTHPAGLNPKAVAAMGEIGIDISRHHSKSVDEFSSPQFDYMITVCDSAKESCHTKTSLQLPGPVRHRDL